MVANNGAFNEIYRHLTNRDKSQLTGKQVIVAIRKYTII